MIGVNPIVTPEAYNYAKLGGVRTPGVIPKGGVSGFKRSTEWEVKKGKGATGATVTDAGDSLVEGSIKMLLWRADDPDDFADWDAFREMLRAARKKGTALDIEHPDINDLECNSVVIKNIGQRVDEGKGLSSVTIEVIEYRKAKPQGGTPAGSEAGVRTGTTTVEHIRPEESALAAAEAEAERLAVQAGLLSSKTPGEP